MAKEILPYPHFGKIVMKYMEDRRYPKSAIARNINSNSNALNKKLQKSNLFCNTLWDYCFANQHDFFKDISLLLPESLDRTEDKQSETEKENMALKAEIAELKRENALLKSLIIGKI